MARFSYLALGTAPRSGGLPMLRPALPSLALPSETRPAAPASPVAPKRAVAREAAPAPATPFMAPLASKSPSPALRAAPDPAPIVDPPLPRATPQVQVSADPTPQARAPLPVAAPTPPRLQPGHRAEGDLAAQRLSAPVDPPLRVADAAAPDAVPAATTPAPSTTHSTADRREPPEAVSDRGSEPARRLSDQTAPRATALTPRPLDDAVPMRTEPPSRNAVPGDQPAPPRADTAPRAAPRSVDVRIGTIEIHSAPAPAPRPVANAAPRPSAPEARLATGYRWGGR